MKFRRLTRQIQLDWKLMIRHHLAHSMALMALLLVAMLKLLSPATGQVSETHLGVMVLVCSTSIFVGASLIWIPRQARLTPLLEVTPLRPIEFIVAKVVVYAGIYGFFGVMVFVFRLSPGGLSAGFLLGLVALAVTQTLAGLWLAMVKPQFYPFAGTALGLLCLFQIPLLALVFDWPGFWWHLLPGFGPLAFGFQQGSPLDFGLMLFWLSMAVFLCWQRALSPLEEP